MLRSFDDVLLPLVARLHGLLNPSRGQTLAEYSLIVTVVAVAVTVAAVVVFRTQVAGAFTAATSCFDGDCS